MQQLVRLSTTFLVFFILLGFTAQAQTSEAAVRGFVYEASSGEPVIFSNVYLEGTSHGGSTDINGYYSITKVPAGKYTLLVTFLGYDTIRQEIVLKPGDVQNQKFNLKESSVSLETVNITAEKN